MSTTRHTTRSDPATGEREKSGFAVGVIIFAVALMVIQGFMQAFQGIVALADDSFYNVDPKYTFDLDVTAWGWIHVILGGLAVAAGLFLMTGAVWARAVAVVLASAAILANFLWMPYYPVWSLTLIAFDVAVIWAVTLHGRDMVEELEE